MTLSVPLTYTLVLLSLAAFHAWEMARHIPAKPHIGERARQTTIWCIALICIIGTGAMLESPLALPTLTLLVATGIFATLHALFNVFVPLQPDEAASKPASALPVVLTLAYVLLLPMSEPLGYVLSGIYASTFLLLVVARLSATPSATSRALDEGQAIPECNLIGDASSHAARYRPEACMPDEKDPNMGRCIYNLGDGTQCSTTMPVRKLPKCMFQTTLDPEALPHTCNTTDGVSYVCEFTDTLSSKAKNAYGVCKTTMKACTDEQLNDKDMYKKCQGATCVLASQVDRATPTCYIRN